MKKHISLLACMLLCCGINLGYSQSDHALRPISPSAIGIDSAFINSKIDSIVNDAIKKQAFPGCRIIAAKDGQVFFNKCFGFLTYDSTSRVQPSTVYDLASITKVAGATPCIMSMDAKGQFDTNLPFYRYWKGFKKNKKELMVSDVLAHQAGLKAWLNFVKSVSDKDGQLSDKYFSRTQSRKFPYIVCKGLYANRKCIKQVYKTINESGVSGKKEYVYSDLSFILYPAIVEKLTGMKYEDYLQTEFYKPLGLSTMIYNPLNKIGIDRIAPTENDTIFRHCQLHGYVHDEAAALMGGVSGHAGLFATADDLATLFQMYLNKGIYNGKRYLPAEIVDKYTSRAFPDGDNRRGLCFDKVLLSNKDQGSPSPLASDESFGHTGFTGGIVWADPENGLLYVFLSNRVYPYRSHTNLMKLDVRSKVHTVFYEAINNSKK